MPLSAGYSWRLPRPNHISPPLHLTTLLTDTGLLTSSRYPELFLGKGSKGNERCGGFDVKARKAWVVGDGNGRVSFTSMKDVGVLLVAALLHPEESKGKALKVNSFTATPAEIVREFERQTGEKWEVEYVSFEDLRKSEAEAWENENPMATAWTLRRIWGEGGTLYDERDNGRIGEPRMETLEEQVEMAIEKQAKAA